jgi:hypothetical protein
MTLISRKLEALALMNEGLTNPEIAEHMNIQLPQVSYLLNMARKEFPGAPKRNYSTRERERNKARGYA